METTPPAPDEEAQKLAAAAQVETDAEEAARAAQEAAKAAQEETHGKPEEQDEQDPKFLLKWFDETYGHKLQGKYKDDEAFLAAYDHLIRMSGKRDEDATLGKQVRDRLAEDQLAKLLADGNLSQAPTKDETPWNPAWITTDDKGQPVAAPGAPKDTLERYQAMQQRMYRMLSEPEKYFQEALDGRFKELEKQNSELRDEIAESKEQDELARCCHQHRHVLYVDGDAEKGWTSVGEKIRDWVDDEQNVAETPRMVARLNYALKIHTDKAGKTRRKPPTRALRRPDVAAKAAEEKSVAERFAANEPLSKVLADLMPEQAGV